MFVGLSNYTGKVFRLFKLYVVEAYRFDCHKKYHKYFNNCIHGAKIR